MGYRYILGTVDDEHIALDTYVAGAAGSHDDVILRLTFGDMWDGLTKTAYWLNSRGENPVYTLFTQYEGNTYDIPIPAAPKGYPGEMFFGIRGVETENDTETRATLSVTTKMRVLPSLGDADTQQPYIDANLAEQIIGRLTDVEASVGDLDELETEDHTSLVAAVNEIIEGGGASNYELLSNKPRIGGVEVIGSKSLAQYGMQSVANMVTTITASSTDTKYPTAKAVYDLFQTVHDLITDAMEGEY